MNVFRDPLHAEHRQPSKEYKELLDVYKQYKEKFGSIDWDDFSAQNVCSIEELTEMVRICLKENCHMEYYHPEWCDECPPDIDL